MIKAPNTDSKRHRQARNCLACDNGDWTNIRASQCCCKERTRAASKERARKEILDELSQLGQEMFPEEY